MKRAGIAVGVAVVLALVAWFLWDGDDAAVAPPPRAAAPTDELRTDAPMPAAARASPQRRHAAETPPQQPSAEPPSPGTIEGVVVEKDSGAHVAGAEILVSRRRAPPPHIGILDTELPGEPQFRATTDAGGRFAVQVPETGPWSVVARAADRVDAVDVARAGESVRLVLGKGAESAIEIVGAPEGRPVAGAEVWVRGAEFKGPPRCVVRSDERGVARVTWRPGDETWIVKAKGYADHAATAFIGKTTVWLAPGYGIRGFVKDRAGAGVAGAVLHVSGSDWQTWLSADDGSFAMDGLRSGMGGCPLDVRADGFLPWYGALEFGDTDSVVVLSRGGTVAGTVLRPDGSPAVGADVDGRAKTDASGAFRVGGFDTGGHTISATWSPPGGAPTDVVTGTARVDVPDGGTLDGVVVRLASRSFVVLRVIDADGRRVTGYRAWVMGGDSINVAGEVATLGVVAPPGTTRDAGVSSISREGRAWSDVRLTVTTQASAAGEPIVVRLPERKEMTVVVLGTDGNDLPLSVRPKLTLGEDWWFATVQRVRSDAASATWTVDAAHRYVVIVETPGFAALRRELTPDEIAAGRASIRLDPGVTVRARLVSTDAEAARGAAVRLSRIGPDSVGSGGRNEAVRGDAGAIRFDRVATGRWRLYVNWATATVTREFDVASGADVDLGDVAIPPRALLRGVVLRPDGSPCGGATVSFAGEGSPDPSPPVAVHEDGSFEIEVTEGARGALLVRKRGLGAGVAPVADTAHDVRVRLAPEGRVDVRIRVPSPRSSGWGWHVQTPDGAVRWQPEMERADEASGFDQHFVFSGLAPGPLVVVVSGTGWERSMAVVVVAGGTMPVTIDASR